MIQYNHANRKGKHRIFNLKAKSRRDGYQIMCVSNTLLALSAYLPFAMFSFTQNIWVGGGGCPFPRSANVYVFYCNALQGFSVSRLK